MNHKKAAAVGWGFCADGTGMELDESVAGAEAESGTQGLGGEEGFKDAGEDV